MREVDYTQEMKNVHADVIYIDHDSLKRFCEESYWKRLCVKCNGLLLVHRDQQTMKVIPQDRCVVCGQQYLYLDILHEEKGTAQNDKFEKTEDVDPTRRIRIRGTDSS